MLVGYARVSTAEQSLNLQIDALRRHGVPEGKIYTDTRSAVAKHRPVLARIWKHLRPGDVLVVWRLDRFARSMKELIHRTEELQQMGVDLRSLTESIDTSTAGGKLIFHVMGALAEFERQLIVERTIAGLQAAKDRGVVMGRKPKLTAEDVDRVAKLLAEKKTITAIADEMGVSRPTIIKVRDRLLAEASKPETDES